MHYLLTEVRQRKVFTTPLLSEAKKRRNCEQFTKKKSRCQIGGVRGVANRAASPKRAAWQAKQWSKDEAADLRKNHVSRPLKCQKVMHQVEISSPVYQQRHGFHHQRSRE